ncbi:type II toxin-antitoxin system PemK/MazF family toxin [Belliella aquatica]|uniref:mRNA interferase n=1 Tax=Belliella aquatica TaxID=1323734 RepID=A0ABQ1N1Z9_9BACT|nr:type II toxin-antitoxin system PemK/MazF family toxin [Belliella aquatica]MCH7407065.1 type II toxin-antitoxin system PemK/MazF family toxin [Belliella aquatica]GGC51575.1 mRNA interferase PemK [Belliella aquatica]
MKQGEIWYADLNPSKGSEQAGFRPVVIISGNLLNKHLKVVITVPLTSKIKNYQGNPILIPDTANNLMEISEMMVFHIRSISKERLVEKIGRISDKELQMALTTLGDITTL